MLKQGKGLIADFFVCMCQLMMMAETDEHANANELINIAKEGIWQDVVKHIEQDDWVAVISLNPHICKCETPQKRLVKIRGRLKKTCVSDRHPAEKSH